MGFKLFGLSFFEKAPKGLERPPVNWADDRWYTSSSEMTLDAALAYSAVWRAYNLISEGVAKLPLNEYKRVSGGKEKDLSNPTFNLLRYEPSPNYTSKIFWQTLVGHRLLKGAGYAYIFRDKRGAPTEFLILNPDNTMPVMVDGRLWFTTKINDEYLKLDQYNVLHVPGLGWDGLNSYSVLEYANESFSQGINAQKYGSKFFKNSARPSVVLQHPNKFTDESAVKRLKDQWNGLYQGIDNLHKTAVLEEGVTVKELSLSAQDAQLIESQKFSLIDIANWFNLPPHKLGDSSRTAYNSLEQENMAYLNEALDPILITIELECRKKLLTERQKETNSHLIEFNRAALLRADLKTRGEYYSKALGGAPWMVINEARSIENMNSAGSEYDEIILPSNNFGTTEEEPEPEPAAEPTESNTANTEAIDRAKSALDHAKQKMLKRIKKDFENSVKRDEVQLFIDNFDNKHKDVIKREVSPVASILEALTDEKDITQRTIKELMREVQG